MFAYKVGYNDFDLFREKKSPDPEVEAKFKYNHKQYVDYQYSFDWLINFGSIWF